MKVKGQKRLAERLALLVPDVHARAKLKVLDVACGTGLVGLHLHALGFRNIDGVGKCQYCTVPYIALAKQITFFSVSNCQTSLYWYATLLFCRHVKSNA